jgi:hypothetical protein
VGWNNFCNECKHKGKKTNLNKCQYKFIKGKSMGQLCGKSTLNDAIFCKKCTKKSRPKFKCQYKFVRGKSVGKFCGKQAVGGTYLCKGCTNKGKKLRINNDQYKFVKGKLFPITDLK